MYRLLIRLYFVLGINYISEFCLNLPSRVIMSERIMYLKPPFTPSIESTSIKSQVDILINVARDP